MAAPKNSNQSEAKDQVEAEDQVEGQDDTVMTELVTVDPHVPADPRMARPSVASVEKSVTKLPGIGKVTWKTAVVAKGGEIKR